MSLIKAFPEVQLFFSNERFTDIELLSFLTEAENKYKEKDERKALHTLIELKILQYEIFPKAEIHISKIVAKARPNKTGNNTKYHPHLFYLQNLTIENIAANTGLRTDRLIHFIHQKDILKSANSLLDKDQFNVLKDMLNSFLMAFDRKGKPPVDEKRLKNKRIKQSISIGNDVYSKIIANGGTGKLIYIRKI